ncbi:hypothetical protein EAL2_c10800 [Peptoclostridium acidaminophilum DSM 3953]|uniref:Uncharacterized protein n=1 Tax=Peptoclostridium acidaminophilum DSM 3953 TaxID=1286171 RepID=W8TEX0_PEPAC|nr:hypothetical protein [Peptoclostridium acidaminophilum]AHM56378.1 hypothetical protein EAL2_c10800 [Peptoclostridium acidaminophilum DSM 3953]
MEDILKQILSEIGSMKNDISSINKRLESLENKVDGLDSKVDKISEKLDDIEAKNAERHIDINNGISKIQQDVTALEAITGKNMTDIAILKAVK